MKRRSFLAGAAGTLGLGRASAHSPVRNPRPDLVTLESSFSGFPGNTPISRICSSPEMYCVAQPPLAGSLERPGASL